MKTNSIDYTAITQRQQKTWAAGDFNQIARQNVCMAEALCEAVDPHAGERVREDLRAVFDRYNRATDGTAVVENTYLLTVAIRA